MVKDEEKKEVKKPTERYVVVSVTTQTSPAIIDTTLPENDEKRIVAVFPPEQEGLAMAQTIQLNNQEKLKGLL